MAGEHTCPGCGKPISAREIACARCYRRLPRKLRRALVVTALRRHRDHQPYLEALREARAWWDEHHVGGRHQRHGWLGRRREEP